MLAADVQYAGFWRRVGAALIDTLLISVVLGVLAMAMGRHADYGLADHMPQISDRAMELLSTAAIVIAFWLLKQGTPGKLLVGARVVDAQTGATLTPGQAVIRYLGYYVSIIPLCLGLVWVAFDGRKQGWHDKLAGTVVILERK